MSPSGSDQSAQPRRSGTGVRPGPRVRVGRPANQSRRPGAHRAGLALLFAAMSLAAAQARTFLSVDEALALAFPGCAVERRTVFLTDAQKARAASLAGEEIAGAIVNPYVALKDGRIEGTAYFDAHRVRTLPETLMIVVAPDGTVRRIEVIAFREPEDYLPKGAWYGQFSGQALDPGLSLKGRIRGVTGATLTARATTSAVRRVLAIHRAIGEGGAP